MLTQQNMEILLEIPFIVWCANLLKSDSPQTLSMKHREFKYIQFVYELISKICLFDFNRNIKHAKAVQWLGKITDFEPFAIRVIEQILRYIEANPNLDADN